MAREVGCAVITAKKICLGQVSKRREAQLRHLLIEKLENERHEIGIVLEALRNVETAPPRERVVDGSSGGSLPPGGEGSGEEIP